MMNVSLAIVIPVKNDSSNLRLCLARLKGVSDVLVIGSGQHDCSQAVAKEYGVEYLAFHWDGKFPKKRNWVLQNYDFGTEWVLFLDADEYVTNAFLKEVANRLSNTTHSGFWLNYSNYFMGKQLHYGDPCPKLALLKLGTGEYERIDENDWSHLDMEVHEHPVIEGTIGELTIPIEHRDYRDLKHWIAKHNEYSDWEAHRYLQIIEGGEAEWVKLTPRQRTKYRHIVKWWFPFAYFCGAYFLKKGLLDGVAGFRVALMKMWYFYTIRLKILALLEQGTSCRPV